MFWHNNKGVNVGAYVGCERYVYCRGMVLSDWPGP